MCFSCCYCCNAQLLTTWPYINIYIWLWQTYLHFIKTHFSEQIEQLNRKFSGKSPPTTMPLFDRSNVYGPCRFVISMSLCFSPKKCEKWLHVKMATIWKLKLFFFSTSAANCTHEHSHHTIRAASIYILHIAEVKIVLTPFRLDICGGCMICSRSPNSSPSLFCCCCRACIFV